ncbi:MAG: hypothetical protein HY831_00370 [Candidatus Aenigmarchaeota archaeon]|nr:hypothetical protein [Candidatus Aenigmarchaeota archaeon]
MKGYRKPIKVLEKPKELPVVVFVNVPYEKGDQEQRLDRVVKLLDHLTEYQTIHNIDTAGKFDQKMAYDALLRFRTSEEAEAYLKQAQGKFPEYKFRIS